MLLARHKRVMQADALAALELTAPFVLGKKGASEWLVSQNRARIKLATKRREARTAQERERIGTTVPVKFPSSSEWTLDAAYADCVVEVCQSLIALRQYQQVSSAVKRMGKETRSTTQVLTAETGGDLLVEIGKYGEAIEFYRHALKLLRELPFDEYGYRKENFVATPLYAYFRGRIQKSLAHAERLLDMERYGEGFVLYRDAERLRRQSHSYLEALMAYRNIQQQCPKTIYSEASTVYSLKCLMALTSPKNRKKAMDVLAERKTENANLRKRISLVQRARAGKEVVEKLESEFQATEERLREMQAVLDLREKTFSEVRKLGKEWLGENKFGPYRGEVLIDFAKYAMEVELDSERANLLYTTAWKWLQAVERADANLSGLRVPGKARAVSAPPPEEKQVNFWGTVTTRVPRIGAIVNRQTCQWYLDDLREQCVLSLGFLHFCRGESEEAIEWYAKAPALDRVTGNFEKSGEWNNYRRLKWGAQHGYLYAYPEDLKQFNEQQRLLVLRADFYYVTERVPQAMEIYRRLLEGCCGRLSPRASAYPHYAYATCIYHTKGRLPAYREYMRVVTGRGGRTLASDRAGYAAAKISRYIQDTNLQRERLALLRKLALSFKTNEFTLKARLLYARELVDAGRIKQGMDILKRFPKNKLGLEELAHYYVREYETAQKKRDS